MWYDRKNIRMLFFFGAALALIGLGLIMMDHRFVGMLLLVVGVALVMICFKILRVHATVEFRQRRSSRR